MSENKTYNSEDLIEMSEQISKKLLKVIDKQLDKLTAGKHLSGSEKNHIVIRAVATVVARVLIFSMAVRDLPDEESFHKVVSIIIKNILEDEK